MSTVFGRIDLQPTIGQRRFVVTLTTDSRVTHVAGIGGKVCVWVVRDDAARAMPADVVLWLFGDGQKVEVPGPPGSELDYIGTALISGPVQAVGSQVAMHVFTQRPPAANKINMKDN